MADDIIALQNVGESEFWDAFARVMGSPDGLLTYRYLNCRQDPVSLEGHMDIRRDMRNPAAASWPRRCRSGWPRVAVTTLRCPRAVMTAVHILDDGRNVRSVVALPGGGPSKSGRTLSFGAGGLVVDADNRDRVIVFTQSMGVKISDVPPGYEYVAPAPSGIADSPELPALHEAFGVLRNERGNWQLPELDQEHASTSGTLHHGATQIALERAAFELASGHARTDALQIEDWTVMYTTAGRVGPFEASGTVIGPNAWPQRYASQVQLVDRGMDDRLIAIGTALFRPVG